MIAEAINFLATLAISRRRRPSEINASVRLWARANRCRKAWAEHEENSKAFIAASIDATEHRRTAVILGSGLLRDVPIRLLSETFETVILVDLQHLASVRLSCALKGYRNLIFMQRDLSGLNELMDNLTVGPNPLAFINDIPDVDLAISANLLSQIGLGAAARLAPLASTVPADSLAGLLSAHIAGLAALATRTVLITDIGYDIKTRNGLTLQTRDLMAGIDMPTPIRSWQWTVVPFGEMDANHEAVHTVIAV